MLRVAASANGGRKIFSSLAVLALAAAGAVGCAPTLAASPALTAAADLQTNQTFTAQPTSQPANWPEQAWWTSYNDAALTGLIQEGLADSPSLAAASARMRRAAAYSEIAGAQGLPNVSGDAGVSSVRQSLNMGFPDAFKSFLPQGWNTEGQASLRIDQQIDVFGRTRAAHAAARAEADVAVAEEAAALLQLSTAIALSYADLGRLDADRAAAQSIVDVRAQTADLVRQRFDAGLENEGSLSQAQSELAAARADLVATEAGVSTARNALAALLGKGPDRGLSIAPPSDARLSDAGLPQNLAADLIGRRPDIVAARLTAEAASARVRAARADFYPNINLTAIVGQQALGLDLFSSADSRYGSVGPAISLPIFSAGRIEGAYRAARAEYDEAVSLYNQTLADALRDVADALVEKRAVAAELEHTRAALAAAESAYRVARQRYEGGLSSYIDVLAVESRLVAERRAAADLEARAFAVDIKLVRALGGGYRNI